MPSARGSPPMPRLLLLATLLTLALGAFRPQTPGAAFAADPPRLFPDGKRPADRRLAAVRDLNDKDFFLKPPETLSAWNARRQAVREQLLVANGLWPLPPKTPLAPVIHGRIDRDGYSVE